MSPSQSVSASVPGVKAVPHGERSEEALTQDRGAVANAGETHFPRRAGIMKTVVWGCEPANAQETAAKLKE